MTRDVTAMILDSYQSTVNPYILMRLNHEDELRYQRDYQRKRREAYRAAHPDGRGKRKLHPAMVGLSTFFSQRQQAFAGLLEGAVQRCYDLRDSGHLLRMPGTVNDIGAGAEFEYRR